MVKPPYFDRLHLKQATWTEVEDNGLAKNTSKHSANDCTAVPKKTGLRRCGKSYRTRGVNKKADLLYNRFSPEEEELVIKLHATIGSRWSIIAQQLPERSDDDVKNLWNTKLKKKLSSMGIDPITHRPFSQILADYGNLGGFPNARTARFAYLNRDIKTTPNKKSDQSSNPQESPSRVNSHFVSRITPSESKPPENDPFKGNTAPTYDHSFDLFSQLQAIKMVTQSSNYNTNGTLSAPMTNECISSSASSLPPESPESTTNKALSSSSSPGFSWSDFIQVDAFLPTNTQELEEHQMKLYSTDVEMKEAQKDSSLINTIIEGSSISNGSFVEAMFERENEIFSETHVLLEEPFYYY